MTSGADGLDDAGELGADDPPLLGRRRPMKTRPKNGFAPASRSPTG